ncbi:Carnitine O-palmitoyltransferase 2, mitochondrial [Aphelenchoides bicaudatus]|nr:Carnitine O-palmitoyltransferase 2, mitochondrial [Aphelenchoides bicaudatus]
MLSRRCIQKVLTTSNNENLLFIGYRFASTASTMDNEEYQFIHKSIVPTYHFQKSLRRLPIPKLELTTQRYLSAVEAVCSENQIEEAKKTVDELLKGQGPELQRRLKQHDNANPHTSYISEPWFDMYLESRLPCPINYNPFMMLAPDKRAEYNDQLTRATNFLISCARFKRSLDAKVLAPEVFHMNPKKTNTQFFRRFCKMLSESVSWFGAVAFKAFPLDMSQYPSLFGGNRIPEIGKDRLHLAKNPQHVLIIHKGNFYAVDVFTEDGTIRAPDDIHACIAQILNSKVDPAEDGQCIGSLTTLSRDEWAVARREILAISSKNNESIKLIDDALFALCLDDEEANTSDHAKWASSLLSGGDGRNRWFDKCFQLIVDASGQATVNFEHSWGDGVAVLRLIEETYFDTCKHSFVKPLQKPKEHAEGVRKLAFDLDEKIRATVTNAQRDHLKRANNVEFATVEYFKMNRDTIKKASLSPDSVMQLAIQLAFYKTYQQFIPTYESSSTAAFKKGRTECIRSATKSTKEAVLALESKDKNDPIWLRQLFKKCSDDHSQLVKDAAMGQGFDRHLLGLKITAQRLKQPLPSLFDSAVYKHMGNFVLSTSTLTTETIVFGGFGPVAADGFGIGYNVVGSKLGAVISANKGQRDVKKFAENLEKSLDQIRQVIEQPKTT